MNNRNFMSALCLSVLLGLTGCAGGLNEVSRDNAAEVAVDDAGYTEETVSDLHAEDAGGYYTVTFSTKKGKFTYEVNKNGIVKSRDFEKKEEGSEQTAQDDEAAHPDENEQQTQEEAEQPNPEAEIRQRALNTGLAYLGLTSADVLDPAVTVDGSIARVSMGVDGSRLVLEISLPDYQVVGSYYE